MKYPWYTELGNNTLHLSRPFMRTPKVKLLSAPRRIVLLHAASIGAVTNIILNLFFMQSVWQLTFAATCLLAYRAVYQKWHRTVVINDIKQIMLATNATEEW
jgi:hypothetical protein